MAKNEQDFRGIATMENLAKLENIIDSKGKVYRFLTYDRNHFGDKEYDALYFRVFDKFFTYVSGLSNLADANDPVFIASPGYTNWAAMTNPNIIAKEYFPYPNLFMRAADLLKPAEIARAEHLMFSASERLTADDFKIFVQKLYAKFPQPEIYFQVAGEMAQYNQNYAPDKYSENNKATHNTFAKKFFELIKLSDGHKGEYLVNAGGWRNLSKKPGPDMFYLLANLDLSPDDFKKYAKIIWAHDEQNMNSYLSEYERYLERNAQNQKTEKKRIFRLPTAMTNGKSPAEYKKAFVPQKGTTGKNIKNFGAASRKLAVPTQFGLAAQHIRQNAPQELKPLVPRTYVTTPFKKPGTIKPENHPFIKVKVRN